jgi:hypothetical protein
MADVLLAGGITFLGYGGVPGLSVRLGPQTSLTATAKPCV